MCNELLLAIIYFLILFLVNSFLFILVKNNFQQIFKYQKIKKILNLFPSFKMNLIPFLYFYNKQESKTKKLQIYRIKNFKITDALIIGNFSKIQSNEIEKNNLRLYFYYKLLEMQYLDSNLN